MYATENANISFKYPIGASENCNIRTSKAWSKFSTFVRTLVWRRIWIFVFLACRCLVIQILSFVMAVAVQIVIFGVVTRCSVLDGHPCFIGIYCLHFRVEICRMMNTWLVYQHFGGRCSLHLQGWNVTLKKAGFLFIVPIGAERFVMSSPLLWILVAHFPYKHLYITADSLS